MQNIHAKYDLLIKNGRFVFPLGQIRSPMDMGIKNGVIIALEEGLNEGDAAEVLDAEGAVVSPGFVETHGYIDLAFAAGELAPRQVRNPSAALDEISRLRSRRGALEELIYARMDRALASYLVNGVTTVRVVLAPPCALEGFASFMRLRQEWKGRMRLLVTLPYEEAYDVKWRQAAKQGLVDAIGCWPDIAFDADGMAHTAQNPAEKTDKAFQLALEYDMPLDIEINGRQGADIASFVYVCDKVLEKKEKPLYGRVSCNQATGLGAVGLDADAQVLAIAKCAKANVRFSTMTTDAMALAEDGRRSVPPVRKLLDAGVNVSVSCGHLRDLFHPFGNGDLLEEALTTAQAHKIGMKADMRKLFEFITYNPAKTLLLGDYGVLPGCRADLVVLDADSVEDALISQAARRYVIKGGRIVAASGKLFGCIEKEA